MGVFYALGVLYCLVGLAEVCENYFVASLEALGTRFGLSEDVSGAFDLLEAFHTQGIAQGAAGNTFRPSLPPRLALAGPPA